MFRIESQIELLSNSPRYKGAPLSIKLRGYTKEEPIIPPAQFKDVKPISVGDVVSFCPTHRELYLRKRLKIRDPGAKDPSWPRRAGKLIEGALEHVYKHYRNESASAGRTVDEIAYVAELRLNEYVEMKKQAFKELDEKAIRRHELRKEDLQGVLTDNIVLDLFCHQGSLNYERQPATKDRMLEALDLFPEWQPADHIKLSKASPDFTVLRHRAIGDVKSGEWRDEYLLTAAGYALGYESAHGVNINLGIIYLVETDPQLISQGRLIMFTLTDSIRQRFLDRRNAALHAVLENGLVPDRPTDESTVMKFCDNCSYNDACQKNVKSGSESAIQLEPEDT